MQRSARPLLILGVTVLMALALAAGCGGASPSSGPEATPAPPATAAPDGAPGPASLPVADGVITAGEYAHSVEVAGVTVHWTNDATHLFLAAEAPAAGWVAVGLDPESRMQGANYVFALLAEGAPTVIDAYGTAPTGAHPADTDLGGTSDVVAASAALVGDLARFEAQLPLDSGDTFDRPLAPGGSYTIIAAYGPPGGGVEARHVSRGSGTIALDATP